MTNFFKVYGGGLAVMLAITLLAFIGCEKQASKNSPASNSQSVKSLPASALSFHKPKDMKTAVDRMRELHDAITGDEAMPDSIEYQIQEVIHGTGASGHSHYYLYDPDNSSSEADHHDEEGEDHDHAHETSDEKIHNVTINAFVELRDLAKWLPNIAAESDMPESEWSKVNDASKKMTPMLIEIVEQSTDEKERRVSYNKQADSMADSLASLEDLNE